MSYEVSEDAVSTSGHATSVSLNPLIAKYSLIFITQMHIKLVARISLSLLSTLTFHSSLTSQSRDTVVPLIEEMPQGIVSLNLLIGPIKATRAGRG